MKGEKENERICKNHKVPVTLFCNEKSCQEIICQTCAFLGHKKHTIIDVSEKVKELKGQMEAMKNAGVRWWRYFEAEISKLEKIDVEIDRATITALDNIRERRRALIDIIEKQAAEHKIPNWLDF